MLALLTLAGPVGATFALLTDSATTGRVSMESAALPSALLGAIGDRVWVDLDHDGMQAPDEPGLGGVAITLLAADGDTPATDANGDVVEPAASAPDGSYHFADLHAGTYVVVFSTAWGQLTYRGTDQDDATDSDPDPATGRTQPVVLAGGQTITTVDAGVWVPAPALTLETRVQGEDADEPPGPSLPTGSTATLDYVVTNTGNEPLAAVGVVDDSGRPVTCPQDVLARLETLTCTRTDVVASGTSTVVGTASATGADSGGSVRSTDPAHHTGVEPLLEATLTANGEDADSASAAVPVDVGGPVQLMLAVRNPSVEAVSGIAVTLDGEAVVCPIATLGPAQGMDCPVAQVTAEPGLHTAVARVTGTGDTSGSAAAASDPASWFGLAPGFSLLKTVLDPATGVHLDADADPGSPGSNDGRPAVIQAGQTAHYRFVMANTGNVALPGASVTDPHCDDAPALISGDTTGHGVLDVGETWRLGCARSEVTAAFTNRATATAGGLTASERARVEVTGGRPSVALDKLVQRGDGSYGDEATIDTGASATFRLEVRNTGERPLVNLRVTDPQVPGCDRDLPGPLAPGATAPAWTCAAAVTSGFTNSAQVSAVPVGGGVAVTDQDSATVRVQVPGQGNLALDKTLVDGTDASAHWSLRVTNVGSADVGGPITVADHLPDELSYESATGDGFDCAMSDATVTCTRAAGLAAGESAAIDLMTRVRPGTPGGPVVNTAEVAAAGGDAVAADDRDTATLVVRGPDLDLREPPPTVATTGVDLPLTGLDVSGLVATAVCFAGIGLLLVWAARRRRAAEANEDADEREYEDAP